VRLAGGGVGGEVEVVVADDHQQHGHIDNRVEGLPRSPESRLRLGAELVEYDLF
jgi:hypothetical protein